MFAANGIANQVVSGAWVPGDYPPGTDYLLITKKTYPVSTTSVSLDFTPTLGGGVVQFTGHAIVSPYGPHNLFDNSNADTFGWANANRAGLPKLFAKFDFPTTTYVSKIFMVPSPSGGTFHFPKGISVYADGVLTNTFSTLSTISPADGLVINYTGTGYNLPLTARCNSLELVFSMSGDAYMGEMELRGGLTLA